MDPVEPVQPNEENLLSLATELGLTLWMDQTLVPPPSKEDLPTKTAQQLT